MSEPASISSGIAARYASAVFDLAKEQNGIAALEADLDALGAGLSESDELSAMIDSPVLSRSEQGAAVSAVAKAMGLGPILSNTLALMAQKRRLFVVPQLITALRAMIAEEKGEVTAEVTSAAALDAAQLEALKSAIAAKVGKQVNINAAVDEALIGGLIVKVGSRMIDTSVASKLANLQNAMKEVG